MTERKLQNKYVPLRLRFRSPAEQVQWERENLVEVRPPTTPLPDLSSASETQKRAQQIKELIRLGNLLRADLGLNEVLQQIVASIVRCTGFRILAVNLIDEVNNYIATVACAGMNEEEEQMLRNAHDPIDKLTSFMRPEFRISQSYFISHEHADDLPGTSIVKKTTEDLGEGRWHPEDAFCVPLFSPREQKLLCMLSLDDPEDGQVPTLESIEVAELFANQAAIAIDNARLFQEREAERVALEEGIAQLRRELEPIQRGDLRALVHPTHQKLQPIGDAINLMLGEISSILGRMQMVTQAVDDHARNVQRSSEFLVRDTSQQERQVNQISKVITDSAAMMLQISERAAYLSKTGVEALDMTGSAQDAVDRAVDGMSKLREATMQSARTMKSLSERGQGISEAILEVSDLSVRLHHLALNAAIEATRAGEHGKGFIPISQEIRSLATGSVEAARNIGGYIRAIQNETGAVSHSFEQSTQHVIMQTELVTQTGVALEVINEVTEQLSRLIEGICNTVENQSQGSQLVVSSVAEILRMTADITQHMREMQQSMAHLVELTNSLRQRIAVFHIGER